MMCIVDCGLCTYIVHIHCALCMCIVQCALCIVDCTLCSGVALSDEGDTSPMAPMLHNRCIKRQFSSRIFLNLNLFKSESLSNNNFYVWKVKVAHDLWLHTLRITQLMQSKKICFSNKIIKNEYSSCFRHLK